MFRIRGFLLFVTILMIGAGWTLFKHVFTRREKQVFLVVIPLQVSTYLNLALGGDLPGAFLSLDMSCNAFHVASRLGLYQNVG